MVLLVTAQLRRVSTLTLRGSALITRLSSCRRCFFLSLVCGDPGPCRRRAKERRQGLFVCTARERRQLGRQALTAPHCPHSYIYRRRAPGNCIYPRIIYVTNPTILPPPGFPRRIPPYLGRCRAGFFDPHFFLDRGAGGVRSMRLSTSSRFGGFGSGVFTAQAYNPGRRGPTHPRELHDPPVLGERARWYLAIRLAADRRA